MQSKIRNITAKSLSVFIAIILISSVAIPIFGYAKPVSAQTASYTITIDETGLPAGTTWTATVQCVTYFQSYDSTSSSQVFHGVPGAENCSWHASASNYQSTPSGQSNISFNSDQTFNVSFSGNNNSSPPSSPSLTLNGATSNTVSLSWTSVSGATSYTVWRSSSSNGLFSNVPSATAITSTSFTDSNLLPSNTYYYQVTTSGPSGTSGPSNTISATTQQSGGGSQSGGNATSTFTAVQNGNWNDPATWGGISPPIAVNAGQTVTIPAGITVTIPQGLSITNSGTNSGGQINNYGTINNLGTINNGGTIDNNLGSVLTNSGIINNGLDYPQSIGPGDISNHGTISNQNTINNDAFIDNYNIFDNNAAGSIINNGSIGLSSGDTITFSAPNTYSGSFSNTGTITMNPHSQLNLNSGTKFVISTGTLSIPSGAEFSVFQGSTLTINSGASLDTSGEIFNPGTVINNGNIVINTGGEFYHTGITINNQGGTITDSGYLLLRSGDTITFSAPNTYSGSFSNTGTITVNSGGILDVTNFVINSGTFSVLSGTTLQIEGTLTVNSGATLSNSNIIETFGTGHIVNNGIIDDQCNSFITGNPVNPIQGNPITNVCVTTPDTTSTSISLNPTTVSLGGQTTVTATVIDTSTNTNPGGTVIFNDGTPSAGGSFSNKICNPSGNNQLVCTATYIAPNKAVPVTISGNYSPNNSQFSSSSNSSPIAGYLFNYYVEDSSGNVIDKVSFDQPYQIDVQIINPNSMPYTYTIQTTENGVTSANGAINWNWQSPQLGNALSFFGLPSEFDAQPKCQVSFSGQWVDPTQSPSQCSQTLTQTVQAGQTGNFQFVFTNKWDWIPPYNVMYLIGSLVWGFFFADFESWAGNIEKYLGEATSSVDNMFTFLQDDTASGAQLPNEGFYFNISDVTPYGSTTIKSGMVSETIISPDGAPKLTEYISSLVLSIPAGVATQTGIAACLTGVFCEGAPIALAIQIALIADQNLAYVAATDPSPEYTQVVMPTQVKLQNGTEFSQLPVFKSLPQNMYYIVPSLEGILEYENATDISLARYQGAVEANNSQYQNIQLQSVTTYSKQRDAFMDILIGQISDISSGFPTMNSTLQQQVNNYISQNGLPPMEQQILSGLGLSSSIPAVTNGTLAITKENISLPSLVTGLEEIRTVQKSETSTFQNSLLQSGKGIGPTIDITSPNENSFSNSNIIDVRGITQSSAGIQKVTVSIDGKQQLPATLNFGSNYNSTVQWNYETPKLSDGPHVIIANSTSNNGFSSLSSILVTVDTVPPEAYLEFNSTTKDVILYGNDTLSGITINPIIPTSMVPAKWGDDDNKLDNDTDKGDAQIRTYNIADMAGNTLTLTEKIRTSGHEDKVRILSLQYNGGKVISTLPNEEKFNWSEDKDHTIKELEQHITIGKDKDKQDVDAKYSLKDNKTIIHVEIPSKHHQEIKETGLVLLHMASNNGTFIVNGY